MLKQDGSKEGITITWTSMFEGSQLVLRFLDNQDDYKRLMRVSMTPLLHQVNINVSIDCIYLS